MPVGCGEPRARRPHGACDDVLRRPEHPYTRMLVSSVPGPGWEPSEVVRLRAEFARAGEAQ
ncbi:hypothetical protein [Nocardiopsis sp. Huas11]|uniref:ABC transporter ATP-binding protein n=1 Tax=Nocardiopsis sp. Huas11 TaxID=2183912 RepID=UPI001F472040|nr:hypothetical protein [Nocardiopsis sp. Huas11]